MDISAPVRIFRQMRPAVSCFLRSFYGISVLFRDFARAEIHALILILESSIQSSTSTAGNGVSNVLIIEY